MEKSFLGLLFLIPVIGLYSGLSVAVTVPLFTLSSLFYFRKSLSFNIKEYLLEIILFAWVLASAYWSINPVNSFVSATKFTSEFFFGMMLIKNINKMEFSRIKIEKTIISAFVFSVILFFTEYFSNGRVSILFRELTQKPESQIFLLHNLDRGVALLTLLSWLVIAIFLKKNSRLAAGISYFVLLGVVSVSDNLAGFVAHIISGFVFLLTRLTMLKNPKILCFFLISASMLMVSFASVIDPMEISQKNDFLPLSAKHRLFIWNFVAENSKEHPLIGIGFNSSREVVVTNDQMIELFDHKFHPLPLHPHNNIMQIYFELGSVGLILYISLLCKYILTIGKHYKTTSKIGKDLLCSVYACFSAYFVIAMISYSNWQSWWVFSILWIIALLSLLIIPSVNGTYNIYEVIKKHIAP